MGLLLSGVGELVAVGTGKAEVPVPRFLPVRPHRPLFNEGVQGGHEVSPGAKNRVTSYLRVQPVQAQGDCAISTL